MAAAAFSMATHHDQLPKFHTDLYQSGLDHLAVIHWIAVSREFVRVSLFTAQGRARHMIMSRFYQVKKVENMTLIASCWCSFIVMVYVSGGRGQIG